MPDAARRLQQAFAGMTTPRRSRFLAKITGWPRLRFLAAVFPDALFVEVTRDPAATASSLLEVPLWDGWRGPPVWRRGPLPPDLDALWQRENRSFVALAAIECALLDRAMRECKAEIDAARLLSVDYAELCSDARDVFARVTVFCGLSWHASFADAVSRSRFVSRNDAWRSRLSAAQQAVLLRTLEDAGIARGRRA